MFNNNFYPTPDKLIHKMLSKINFKSKVEPILEPSAGSGNLADAIAKEYSRHHNGTWSKCSPEKAQQHIDTIEIDNNLKYILQGKGYKVVHDDFLTFNTMKYYRTIIANFPFSEGDKHLKKCLDMININSGQLVCIVNAETIKNPYSNLRKSLLNQLEYLNAEIEFLEGEFLEAERKTSVEVALINVVKDIEIKDDSIIINKLRQEEIYDKTYKEEHYLVEGDFINNIISQYNFEVKAGIELIREYYKMKPYILQNFGENCESSILSLSIGSKGIDSNLQDTINTFIESVRHKYWSTLFHNPEFTKRLTNNLQRDLHNRINELVNYDFSLYNIREIQMQMNKNIVEGVEETIFKLFEEFTFQHSYYPEFSKNIHLFNGWKSNSCYKINKKIVTTINGYRDLSYSWGGFKPTHYECLYRLRDIEKVLSYLDKGDLKEVDLTERLKEVEKSNTSKKIQLKYFEITFYKKGTAHIVFTDEDLLNRFNRFGCMKKGWLPPSYGKAKYNDMTKEEQQIIKDFEGEKEYNKVMGNVGYYLYNSTDTLLLAN